MCSFIKILPKCSSMTRPSATKKGVDMFFQTLSYRLICTIMFVHLLMVKKATWSWILPSLITSELEEVSPKINLDRYCI